MELSLKALSLVLGCLALFSFQFSTASSSLENQYCGNEKFYCPENGECYDRTLRCTSARVCLDSNGNEAKCYGRGSSYDFYRKKAKLKNSSSSRKKRSVEDFKHWFVEYRGFVYEFGPYGFQELDVNDPNYKYGPGREKVESEDLQGSSSCTRNQIIRFTDKWIEANPEYKRVANNCQDFAKALLGELRNNCSNRKRRNNESLKAQCSGTSAVMPRMIFNWKLYALFGLLILQLHIN